MLRFLTLVLLSGLAMSAWAEAYYWVDEQGKRHYSDRVPPQESKRERKVIDQRGFTVQTLPGEKTAAEREAEEAAAAEVQGQQQSAMRSRAEQAAYDNLLVTSYSDVSEIENARDERLSLIDAGIEVDLQVQADNEKQMQDLRAQESKLLEQGKPVPDNLKQRIADTQRRLNVNKQNLRELEKQRGGIEAKYAEDIARYKLLRSTAN